MAYQPDTKRRSLMSNRTPAPDVVDNIRSPVGAGYGMNGPQNRSSINPGMRVQSQLGQAMAESVGDSDLQDIIDGKARSNPDRPLDNFQTRSVDSLEPAVPVHPAMKRQQQDYSTIGRAPLPKALASDEAPAPSSVRKP